MRASSTPTVRGTIGMIALLLVLLVIAFLVIKNFRGTATTPGRAPNNAADEAQKTVDQFKQQTERINELQKQRENLPPNND